MKAQDKNTVLSAPLIDGNGEALNEGDRVYSYDYNSEWKLERVYGTLLKNKEYPNVSEWFIAYDDGQNCAVLDTSLIFNENKIIK